VNKEEEDILEYSSNKKMASASKAKKNYQMSPLIKSMPNKENVELRKISGFDD